MAFEFDQSGNLVQRRRGFEFDANGEMVGGEQPDSGNPYLIDADAATEPDGPEKPNLLRRYVDMDLSAGMGVVGTVQSLTNIAGADNPVSRGLDTVRGFLGSLQSEYQQNKRREHSNSMAEAAANGGIKEEIATGVTNFFDDPVNYSAEGFGSFVVGAPLRLVGAGAKVMGVGARTVAGAGYGAGIGVGAVKGSQYEEVKDYMLSQGASPEEAEAAAVEAQAYSAKNIGQHTLGAGLGAVDLLTGGDVLVAGLGKIAGAGPVKRGLIRGAQEAGTEFPQAFQEKYAGNVAAIDAGDTGRDPTAGAWGAGTQEALMGGVPGSLMGVAEGYTPTDEEKLAAGLRTQDWAAAQQRALQDQEQARIQQEQEAQAKSERDNVRAAYAGQLPYAEFKKQFVEQALAEQVSPEAIDEEYQAAFRDAVANEAPPPDRAKFEKDYRKNAAKEIGKADEAITAAYYQALDNMAAEDVEFQRRSDSVDADRAQFTRGALQNQRLIEEQGQLPQNISLDVRPKKPYTPEFPDVHAEAQAKGVPFTGVNHQQSFGTANVGGEQALNPAGSGKLPTRGAAVTVAKPTQTAGRPVKMQEVNASIKSAADQGLVADDEAAALRTKLRDNRTQANYQAVQAELDRIVAMREPKIPSDMEQAVKSLAEKAQAQQNKQASTTTASGEVRTLSPEEIALQYNQGDANGVQATAQVPAQVDAQGRNGQEGNPAARADRVAQGETGRGRVQAAPAPGLVAPKDLSSGQQAAYDVLEAAAKNNELDQFFQADGKTNFVAIAQKAGLKGRQAAHSAVRQAVKKFAEQLGTTPDGIRAFLRQRAVTQRKVEAADEDMLGLSPAEFTKTSLQVGAKVDSDELFGSDEGATQGMTIIDSVGKTQIAQDEDKEATTLAAAKPDPVADKRAAEARAKREAAENAVLQRPEAQLAAEAWDDFKSDTAPAAAELSKTDAAEWTLAYMEYMETADEAQLNEDQRDIEHRYAAQSARPVPGEQRVLADRSPGQGGGTETTGEAVQDPGQAEAGSPAGQRDDGRNAQAESAQGVKDPLEKRVEALRPRLTDKQSASLDRLIARLQDGDITPDRFKDELDGLEQRAAPEVREAADGESAQGTTREAFLAAIGPLLMGRQLPHWINLHDTADDATAGGTRNAHVSSRTVAWVQGKNAHFILDRVKPGRELAYFLHEVGAHLGLKGLLPEQTYTKLIGQIKEWYLTGEGIEGKAANVAVKKAQAVGLVDQFGVPLAGKEDQANDEILAYFIQDAVERGVDPTAMAYKTALTRWFRTLWAAFKVAIRKLDLNPEKLTARNVVDLAYGAAKLELTGTERGARKDDIRFANDYGFDKTPSGAFASLGEAVDEFVVNPRTALDKAKLGWMTLEQMAARTDLASLKGYITTVHKMQADAKDIEARAAEIDRDWVKLGDVNSARLGDVMVRSTLMGYDPTTKDAPANAEQSRLKGDLRAIPGGVEMYAKVRDFYKDLNDEKRQVITDAAKASGKTDKEVARLFAEVKGPYFPLMRMGDWYAVLMSAEVRNLTAKQREGTISKAEEAQLATLRKDPKHYQTKSFDSRRDAEKFAKQSGFAHSYVNTQRERISRDVAALPDFAKFRAYIGAEFDSATRAKLDEMMAEMYFDMLPQTSGLKQQMKREGIHGATFGRSEFARSAIAQAHVVSRLKHADALSEAMVKIDRDADGGGVDARLVYNELQKRNALAMDTNAPAQWVQIATTGSFLAHLGVSPAYWLTNASQVPMITLPWLAARHGFGDTNQALAKAMADVHGIVKSSLKAGSWRFEFDWRGKFPEGTSEHEMFKHLLERSKLDITIENDLVAVADGRHTKLTDAVKFLNTPVRTIELYNRGITGLAAYRLALKKFDGDQEKAIEHAIRAVNDTQLDYSGLNAARHMNSVLGSKSLARVMMQFRKYQQGMIYLISSSAYDAVKAADPDVKREARQTLFGLFVTTGLMAGSLGLPAAGTVAVIANIIGQAFDDDDDPFDAEAEWKNFIIGAAGKDLGEVLLKGLPSMVNVDASKRVGMGDVFDPVPFYRQGSNGRESASNLLAAVAGAPFGTVADIWDGIDKIGNGDVAKGMEKVVPLKLAQNAIRAARYSAEGMTDSRGNTVLPEDRFSPWDLTLRTMGFQTTEEATYYEANEVVNNAKYAALKVRARLIREATRDGHAVMNDEIREFNRRHPKERITHATLVKSLKQKRTMVRERTSYGVQRSEQNKPYMEKAAFAEEGLDDDE